MALKANVSRSPSRSSASPATERLVRFLIKDLRVALGKLGCEGCRSGLDERPGELIVSASRPCWSRHPDGPREHLPRRRQRCAAPLVSV